MLGFWISTPESFMGNTRALFDYYFTKDGPEVFLLCKFKPHNSQFLQKIESLYPGVKCLHYKSREAAYHRLRCPIYFITHGAGSLKKGMFRFIRGIKIINLWHGIPIKGMGNLDAGKNESLDDYKLLDSYTVASELERSCIAGCFHLPGHKVQITGNPRNDFLTMPYDELPQDLQTDENALKALAHGRRILLYAPTFRDYSYDFEILDKSFLTQLKQTLQNNNCILLLRPHPKDSSLFTTIEDNKLIYCVDSKKFPCTETVLRVADCLITDYSSIWIDYLLLDRPILGFCPDLEQYQKNRGFLFDFQSFFPSPILSNKNELLTSLLNELGITEKQTWLKEVFHKYQSGFCLRVDNLVQDKLRDL